MDKKFFFDDFKNKKVDMGNKRKDLNVTQLL